MEFFIPSLFIFLIASVVSFAIIPRFSPIIIALLSVALLSFGIYHHYKMFKDEYKLSTWQQSLKLYAPAIMIGGILLFIIYGILSFFSGPSVPVPTINVPNISIPSISLPSVSLPSANKLSGIKNIPEIATNTINNALSNTAKRIKDMTENINSTTENKKQTNNKNGNLSRSFLEVL